MMRLTSLLVALAAPATAQEWSVAIRIDPPVAYETAYSGTVSSYAASERGGVFGIVEAFRGPDVRPDVPCAQVDWFEVDFFFGQEEHHDLQFLFGLDRQPTGGWRVDQPAAFITMAAGGQSAVVALELYEGPQITLTDFACLPDGRVRVGIDYAFAGPPQTDKGPDWLSLSGSASGTMPLYNYDQY